jgi:ribosomal protein L23
VQVRDENDNIVVLDDETRDLINSLRSKPEMKMLFSVSKNATKEDIIKAVKIIEALKDHKEGEV